MNKRRIFLAAIAAMSGSLFLSSAKAQEGAPPPTTSFIPVVEKDLKSVMQKMVAEKPAIAEKHSAHLQERYDLANAAADGATMFRGKPLQKGVRVKLPEGTTWDQLGAMSPADIKTKKLW